MCRAGLIRLLAGAAFLSVAAPALAQTSTVSFIGSDRKAQPVDAAHPLPTTGSGGGGGGGAVTAVSGAFALGSIVDIGTGGSPGANTINGRLATIATNTAAPTPAGESHIGEVGGHVAIVGASFTRPANTTAYAVNQLFANSTTAGSVAAVSAAACRVNQGHGSIIRASLSNSNPLAYNQQFRLHVFKTAPTSSVGDGGTWAGSVGIVAAIERGTIDVTLADKGSDGAKGFGTANVGNLIGYDCASASSNIYVLIETLGAYTPTSGETATVALEVVQD